MITAPRLRTLPRPPDREVGAALPLVLAFVALFVVLVAALSGLGYTTSATARVSTDLRTKVSAADDALDVALRAHTAQLVSSGFQGDGLAACDDRMVAFPGVGEVEVECRLVASSYERAASPGSNAPEEAILAFDSGSKSVHHTNRAPIAVRGDVRSNGTLVAPGQNRHGAALEILDGNVDVKACRPSPGAQIIVDGGTLNCSWTGSVGSIESAIAGYGIPTAAASIGVGVVPSTCPNRVARIQPGVFSTAQQLTDLNKLFRNELWPGADCEVFWFEPGMYRFGYSGVLQLRGTVVGGTPAGWHPDSAPTPSYPYGCERWDESTTDPDAVAGVLFLLSGHAQVSVLAGTTELCPYHLGDPATTQHVSVRAIHSSEAAPVTATAAPAPDGTVTSPVPSTTHQAFASAANIRTIGDSGYAAVTLAPNQVGSVYLSGMSSGGSPFSLPAGAAVTAVHVRLPLRWSGATPDHVRLRLGSGSTWCQWTEITPLSPSPAGDAFRPLTGSACSNDAIKDPAIGMQIEAKARSSAGTTVELDGVELQVTYTGAAAWQAPAANNRFAFQNSDVSHVTVWGTIVTPESEIRMRADDFCGQGRGYLRGVIAYNVRFSGGSYQHPSVQRPGSVAYASATVVLRAKVGGETVVSTRAQLRAEREGGVITARSPLLDYWIVAGSGPESGSDGAPGGDDPGSGC